MKLFNSEVLIQQAEHENKTSCTNITKEDVIKALVEDLKELEERVRHLEVLVRRSNNK